MNNGKILSAQQTKIVYNYKKYKTNNLFLVKNRSPYNKVSKNSLHSTGSVRINVTLRRVHVTTVAVEK
jgi:hypothetical protein